MRRCLCCVMVCCALFCVTLVPVLAQTPVPRVEASACPFPVPYDLTEGETLSCGTGVTAAALSAMARGSVKGCCEVVTRGGQLVVEATPVASGFVDVHLCGPVGHVFSGTVQR